MTKIKNWSPANIFDLRGKTVRDRSGDTHLVELYAGGWSIGKAERMDIWEACSMLNNMQAEVA